MSWKDLMTPKTRDETLYDEKCLELATHFLCDEQWFKQLRNSERLRLADRLAQAIQQTVDDWFTQAEDPT
jgi:hypothetical protein